MKVRILIVDDHEVLREGLKTLVTRSRPEWEICGEATDGIEGVQAAQELQPDLIILDLAMPHMNGFEALAQMRKAGVRTPVLIFTTHHSDRLASEIHEAGGQGYVPKSEAARKLVLAIETILAGGTFFGALPEPVPAPPAGNKANTGTLLRVALDLAT